MLREWGAGFLTSAVFNLCRSANVLCWKSTLNPLPMFHYRLPWLAAFCCAAVSGLVSGKENPEEPALAVSLDGWEMSMRESQPFSEGRQSFSMDLMVREMSSGWKVAYGEEASFELDLKDSEGSSAEKTSCHYRDTRAFPQDNLAGTIFLRASSWLPSEKARWVEAKGELPFVMYRDSAVSESVTLKMTVKDFSVPLVLKNAGLDGEDVKVEVKGYYDENGLGQEEYVLRVGLHSSVPLGFLDFELDSGDENPLLAKSYGSSSGRSAQSYDWHQYFRMKGKKVEEVKVAVKYAEGLRKIMVPVSIRCGLSGAAEQQDTPNKEK